MDIGFRLRDLKKVEVFQAWKGVYVKAINEVVNQHHISIWTQSRVPTGIPVSVFVNLYQFCAYMLDLICWFQLSLPLFDALEKLRA